MEVSKEIEKNMQIIFQIKVKIGWIFLVKSWKYNIFYNKKLFINILNIPWFLLSSKLIFRCRENLQMIHEWCIYYIDACEILRFPSERKTTISPSEINLFILLWDVASQVSSQSEITLTIQNKNLVPVWNSIKSRLFLHSE